MLNNKNCNSPKSLLSWLDDHLFFLTSNVFTDHYHKYQNVPSVTIVTPVEVFYKARPLNFPLMAAFLFWVFPIGATWLKQGYFCYWVRTIVLTRLKCCQLTSKIWSRDLCHFKCLSVEVVTSKLFTIKSLWWYCSFIFMSCFN